MPRKEKKTHRLSIFLIKKDVSDDAILDDEYDSIDVGIGKLYYKLSNPHTPDWMELFSRQGYTLEDVYSASASAILLIKTSGRNFAVAFGPAGRHMLLSGVHEERFGLIVTLNSVDPKSIRSIDTKTLESEPMQVREQATKGTETSRFGFNPESDLVRAITGTPSNSGLGSVMVGKDSLKISILCDLGDLKPLFGSLLKKFGEDTYKKNGFEWIDQMLEIQNLSRIEKLNITLIEEISKKEPSKLWLTVPDIIDWDDVEGFKYSGRKNDKMENDLHIKDFKDLIAKPITLELLHQNKVHMFSSSLESVKERWKVYDCIYFECSTDGSTYFLSNGKWYEIEKKLVKKVNAVFDKIPKESKIKLPVYDHDSEADYNKSFANGSDLLLFDADNFYYGGAYSKIEFCDVYSTKKKMIHVKRYSGSSTLSHLFNQGANSAEALLDSEFRDLVNNKLPAKEHIKTPNDPPKSFEVVFGIVSKSNKELDIPFFSKLSLKHIATRLSNLGFEVSLLKIKNMRES